MRHRHVAARAQAQRYLGLARRLVASQKELQRDGFSLSRTLPQRERSSGAGSVALVGFVSERYCALIARTAPLLVSGSPNDA